jgi:hypothetical protein
LREEFEDENNVKVVVLELFLFAATSFPYFPPKNYPSPKKVKSFTEM